MVAPCPLGAASHLFWLGGWELLAVGRRWGAALLWHQDLAYSLAWTVSMCEASRELLPELRFLLDGVWLGGHLGDFKSWDLHLCA